MRTGQVWLVLTLVLVVWPGMGWAQTPARNELEPLKRQLAAQQQQIQQLQEMLRRQGMLLEGLQQQLAARTTAPPESGGAADAPPPGEPTAAQQAAAGGEQTTGLNKQIEGLQKKVEGLGNLRFFGDLRVRYEPSFQDGTPQRHRERGRLRFGATVPLTKELTGGFRIATGGLDNGQTTNQTFTGFFTRKPLDLDQYWLTYKPARLPWYSFTAGKFAYTWYRTELTFDNDINAEGFSQTLSFDFKDSPLTNLTLVGFALPFNELAAAGDSIAWGGQVQTQWKLSERVQLGLHAAGVNFRNADSIAQAIGAGTLRPSLALTNRVRLNNSGAVVGYVSKFAYLDLIAELNYRWRPRWPVRLTLDFVNNTRAADERSGYWAELALGRTQEKGDWQLGYTLIRIERDAIIGAFNFDDLRSGTNVLNHRFKVDHLVHKNITLEYTLLVGRLFNPHENLNLVPAAFQPQARDPFLLRMQFDVIYKF